MRNADQWVASKYVRRGDTLVASRDVAEVGVGSRLVTDRVAAFYGRYLPTHARGRLIDLGCGKVPLYGAYRHLVDEVVCVDWPQSVHRTPYLDAEADLAGRLPFPDASFDTIVLSDVLEHLPEPQLLWNEMARMLRPGGRVLMNVPFLYSLHEVPHDYARYTEFGLRRLVRQAGLSVTLLEPVGGSLHVLADLLAKHLAHLPGLGHPLAAAVQGVVGLLDRTALGARIVRRTATHFPLGYFVIAERGVVPPAP